MQLFVLFLTALFASAAPTCTDCPFPGTFSGDVGLYTPGSTNTCGITVTAGEVIASLPPSFFSPPDETSCGETISVTLTSDGKTVTATIVNSDPSLSGDNINLSSNGLADLAPDADPNHGTGPVTWTIVGA